MSAMTPNAPNSDNGTASAGMAVASGLRRNTKMVVGSDGGRLLFALEAAFGCVDTRLREGGADVLERKALIGESARVDLPANRRLLLADDRDVANTRHLRELLGEHRIGVVVHL